MTLIHLTQKAYQQLLKREVANLQIARHVITILFIQLIAAFPDFRLERA